LLTDYHVHLRPDEEGSTAERYFTPSNVDRYREAADERGIAELGVAEHIHRFVQSLDIWQHPWYRYWAEDDVDEYCDFVREQGLKLGIEADFLPGREDRVANMLDGRPWDYVVGSVHFMGEDAVDVHGEPDWESWDIWRGADPEKVWSRYFETLGEAARTGMFDILAHPDLVKVFGDRVPMPDGDLRRFYDRAMEGIAESDVAVEVSTAGLRKPAGQIYPAAAFLEMCLEAGRPVALSSDAHTPEQLGYEYERAVEWLDGLGVSELSVFEGRARRLEPIGWGSARGELATARRHRLRHPPPGGGPPAGPGRSRDRGVRGRPCRPQRRRRPDARGDRRPPRSGRPWRHRPALPGHRRALARRRLHRAPARSRRKAQQLGLQARERRRNGRLRSAKAEPLP
jgi:histidinol-phosphatase (PHP family)